MVTVIQLNLEENTPHCIVITVPAYGLAPLALDTP